VVAATETRPGGAYMMEQDAPFSTIEGSSGLTPAPGMMDREAAFVPSDHAIALDKPRSCPVCDKSLDGMRPDAKYCSRICKHTAYKNRRGLVTAKPPQEVVCQYKKCSGPIVGRKSNARYCSSNCQKMDFHNRKEAKINMIIKLMQGKK
jgi:predicted nucleic acid-binding Zn ribbon protein